MSTLSDDIRRIRALDVLVIAEECPFCEAVLENIDSIRIRNLRIVNLEKATEEVIRNIESPVTPMIVHFEGGREKHRAVGLNEILAYRPNTDTADEADTVSKTQKETQKGD